jgi:predicted metal-dependent peptidase
MVEISDKANKILQLSRDILILSRNTLLVNLRFLDAALGQFKYVPFDAPVIGTDGLNLFYNPMTILTLYQTGKEDAARGYLHMVLHCIFRHMYVSANINRRLWNLACDIAVENAITDLNVKSVKTAHETEMISEFHKLEKEIGRLTAEKIYRYLRDSGIKGKSLNRLERIFYVDEHSFWYRDEMVSQSGIDDDNNGSSGAGSGNTGGRSDNTDRLDEEHDKADKNDSRNNSSFDDRQDEDKHLDGSTGKGEVIPNSNINNRDEDSISRAEQEEIWKQISERMQMDLETFSKDIGKGTGNMIQNLREVNREKYDYAAFLKKFAVRGELMWVSDDEFDYIYYTYGLKMYGRMPLIEPLEYKEAKRIREFVIAIDTSASVIGSQVEAFITKTYNILKSTESFFSKINLHIIQCDVQIKEHVRITTKEEFDEYISNMKIIGAGGTDFRPVFEAVDEMLANKEFRNLKGLIYFTDGYGTFPSKKPDYDTAFVFVNDDYEKPQVPAWAIRLVLPREDLVQQSADNYTK